MALRLTSRIFSRSLRPTNGCSFSAISWAASRGWSFCGRRGKSTIWLIGTKPRMPQSTMRPPLLWSMTGASMITPASNSPASRATCARRRPGAARGPRGPPATRAGARRRGPCRRWPAGPAPRHRGDRTARAADHAFALGTDIDQDLVLVDPDDLALDDVAVLEALDVGVLLRQQLFHRGRLGTEVARRRDGFGLGGDPGLGRGVRGCGDLGLVRGVKGCSRLGFRGGVSLWSRLAIDDGCFRGSGSLRSAEPRCGLILGCRLLGGLGDRRRSLGLWGAVAHEPSLGLAPIVVNEVFETIARIRDAGVSVLLVEQNAAKAFAVSDFVYALNAGRVVYEGASKDAVRDLDVVSTYMR